MKIKEKTCKNEECGKKFLPIQMLQRCCSASCESKTRKAKAKQRESRVAESQKEKLNSYMKSAVTICHSYIRMRDKGKPCISCGAPWNSNFQAGHLFSGGGHANVKFNEQNINGQCPKCNGSSSFSQAKYIEEFEKRYSPEEFEILRAEAYEPKRWTSDELQYQMRYYRGLIQKHLGVE